MKIIIRHNHQPEVLDESCCGCRKLWKASLFDRVERGVASTAESIGNILTEGTPKPSNDRLGLREPFGADLSRMVFGCGDLIRRLFGCREIRVEHRHERT